MRRIQLMLFAVAMAALLPSPVVCELDNLKYPIGDVRNCAGVQGRNPNKPLLRMDVLPGLGFDNLRNLDMGQVLDFNYSTCQVSGDGLYLLPDNVYLIPIQQSRVSVFAETFDSFQQYRSETAVSVNLQFKYSGMFSSIGGSFSTDYQHTKTKMVNDQSTCARVSLRYKLYTAQIQVDAQLHRAFKSRLMDIAANIQNNNTKLAHYLAELLVRDYGTHVITSVDAGAGLSQTTFVSDNYRRDEEDRSLVISASASASFFGAFKVSANVKTSTAKADIDGFNKNTKSAHISTYGGPMYRVGNFTLTDWEDGVLDHLVAIDRSGVPLYSVINTNNVPELPDTTLLSVMDYVYHAVTKYYKVNTVVGCMDPTSSKFNFQANMNDKSCGAERMNYTFGGIFQTCQMTRIESSNDLCKSVAQTNPLTQGYSCPTGYTPILLHTGTVSANYPTRKCRRHCAFFKFFCHNNCWVNNLVNSAKYEAYWCAYKPGDIVSDDSGYMFGGVYTSKQQNLLTGARSCPPYFYPLHFGEDIWVCVSADANGEPYSIPFGGFDSCTNGNALAATASQFTKGIYPHRCGKHYSQFLATIDEGCEISFCADMKAIKKQQPHPPRLPPYHALPRMSLNVTNTLVVRGAYGTVWIKNEDGSWEKFMTGRQTSEDYLRSLAQEAAGPSTDDSDDGGNSGGSIGVIVGLVIGSAAGTILIGAIIVLVVFGVRRVRAKRRTKNLASQYLVINEETNTGGGSTASTAGNSNV